MRYVFLMALMVLSYGAMAEQTAPVQREPAKIKMEQPKSEVPKAAVNAPAQSEDQMLGALQTAFEKAEAPDDGGTP